MKRKAFCSWSGGKDSCLALYRAIQDGYNIQYLLTMFDEKANRSRSHALSREIIEAQAQALNIKLVTAETSWQNYEKIFIENLQKFNSEQITHGIFGDIDLESHREWEEKVCSSAKIEAVLPLWLENRRKLVDEFIAEGFKAIVVCVNEKYLDTSFCGRMFDQKFIADLPNEVDACGENGEFHTFVFDGKIFKETINFEVAEVYRHETVFPSGDLAKFSYAKLELK